VDRGGENRVPYIRGVLLVEKKGKPKGCRRGEALCSTNPREGPGGGGQLAKCMGRFPEETGKRGRGIRKRFSAPCSRNE